jgi:predicted ATPase
MACFAEAVTIASQQRTKWWELRAALSMDRLEMRQGNSKHTQLTEIYSSFTEGFETADLKQTRAQLDVVSVS